MIQQNHNDPLVDLLLECQKQQKYVRKFEALDINVELYSADQCTVIEKFAEKKKITAYWDATGSIASDPFPEMNYKRIYMYTLVTNIHIDGKSKILFPVMMCLKSNHTTDSLHTSLAEFKAFYCAQGYAWPPFEGIVTDYSFANLNALSLGFNGMSLPNI